MLLPGYTVAQYQVMGSHIDANGAPIPYSSVLLLNSDDTTMVQGQITDESGNFLIETNQSGQYLVALSSVGFKEVTSNVFSLNNEQPFVDLGNLSTDEDVDVLNEVVVQADKPFFEQKIDRTVINVQSNITAAGGSALDVLARSPGVTVDRMNNQVALSGKSGTRIMINGKLTQMPLAAAVQMLDGMNAENIEMIELITTPPAKYEAGGDAGMINIVLKKNTDIGTNGNVSLFGGYGREERYGGGFNFNHRTKSFNLYGDYSFRRIHANQLMTQDRSVLIDGDLVHVFNDLDRDTYENFHSGRLGFDWDVSPKTLIASSFNINKRKFTMESFTQIDEQVGNADPTSIEMVTNELNGWRMYVGNFNLSHDFNESNRVSFDLDYIDYYQDQPTDYALDYFNEQHDLTNQGGIQVGKETPITTWVGKIDYWTKVSDKVTIEAGLKGIRSDLVNEVIVDTLDNGLWVRDSIFTNYSEMDENIKAAYVSTSIEVSDKLDLQMGIRYEHTTTNIDSREGESLVNRKFGNWFPSIFMINEINKDNSWVLSYSRRVTRPSFGQLAPFVLFVDPNNIYSGNVNLLPALTHALKAEFRHKAVLMSLQYSHDKNAIVGFQPGIDQENRFISITQNLDYQNNFSLTLAFPLQLTKWWEIQNNLIGSYINLRADFLESPVEISTANFNFNSTWRFTFSKKYSAEISGFYQSKVFFGITDFGPNGAMNLGLERKFEYSSLRLVVNDVFRTNKWRMAIDLPEENLISHTILDFDQRFFSLTYTQSFGNRKLQKRRGNRSGSSEEQRRFN